MQKTRIHSSLLAWYDGKKRDLPWRRSRDPYRIWISEIMLQQTRVETVIPYYNRFLTHFPDLETLANAQTDQLLNLWAGLGYYSRARNLQAAARQVMADFGGVFPENIEDIRSLKGIGPYTSAAIASIAFDQPHLALDGNLERVLSRLIANRKNPKREGRKEIELFGAELVKLGRPGDVNQAFMDLAASICLPKLPRCSQCPLTGLCEARKKGIQSEIPIRAAKPPPLELSAKGLILVASGEVLLARRPEGKWLSGLWDIPWWIDGEGEDFHPDESEAFSAGSYKRTITKHKIYFEVQGHICARPPSAAQLKKLPGSEFKWVKLEELHGINLPRPSEKALAKALQKLHFSSESGR